MPLFICTACRTQYPESAQVPAHCVMCEEERQYVPPRGQTWTTLDALRQTHTNTFREYEKGIIGIGSTPAFAIGQRALFVHTDKGNILWDCIATLDDATVTMINGLGGIDAIAISHPHFYTTMVEWAHAFRSRIYLHAADKQWIMRTDPAIELWDGQTKPLWDGVTLVRCGGHFEGGTVLHWAGGAGGRGIVCAGDILTVTTDRSGCRSCGAIRISFLCRRARSSTSAQRLSRSRSRRSMVTTSTASSQRTPKPCWKHRSRVTRRLSKASEAMNDAGIRPKRPQRN